MVVIRIILASLRIHSHWMYILGLVLMFFALIAEAGQYQQKLLIIGGILFFIDFILGLGWLRAHKEEHVPKRTKTSILIVYGLAFISLGLFALRNQIEVAIDPVSGEALALPDRLRLFPALFGHHQCNYFSCLSHRTRFESAISAKNQ